MISIELFNNFNPAINSISSFEINYDLKYETAVILLNLTSYFYLFLKFYKIICYSKMAFDWLPMINPYVWPFSFFNLLTAPYFGIWSRILPTLKLDKSSLEVSGIVGLEALNAFVFLDIRAAKYLLVLIQEMEKIG